MHSTCTDRTTKSARRYVSPNTRPLTREEAETRALAYALKNPACDRDLIDAAAREMAKQIDGQRGYLIPVPDHTGNTTANRKLAASIAFCTGNKFTVEDALFRTAPTESACERHKKRLPAIPVAFHNIEKRTGHQIPLRDSDRIYFVDNVITSGNTIEACRVACFGLGTGLVYADAHHDAHN